jgi:ABC-type polysaccharide transport system permease subunit
MQDLENFAEILPKTSNSAVCLFSVIENTITKVMLTQVAKKPLAICNSNFFIFLNQIRAERDQKIIVWVEYFPYKYSFKVISND